MAPTTTSMAPTTSAPPQPPLLNFTLLDPMTHVPCLALQLRAAFAIRYGKKGGGNSTVNVTMPTDTAMQGGECGNASQSIRLAFRDDWLAEFTFTKQEAGGYILKYLRLQYEINPAIFPNAANPGQNMTAVGNETYFSVGSGSDFYTCSVAKHMQLDASVAMDTREFQAQAFRTNNGTGQFYGTRVQCQDDVPIDNVVPIVVGAALAGLVIIVLVAYLIGRRRHSSGGGYQSV